MKNDPDLRIIEPGLELPPAPSPGGVYKPVLATGNLLTEVFGEENGVGARSAVICTDTEIPGIFYCHIVYHPIPARG